MADAVVEKKLMNDIFEKRDLIKQINNSSKKLKSYIMSLEAGLDTSIILHNEQLRQENEELKFIISKLEDKNK